MSRHITQCPPPPLPCHLINYRKVDLEEVKRCASNALLESEAQKRAATEVAAAAAELTQQIEGAADGKERRRLEKEAKAKVHNPDTRHPSPRPRTLTPDTRHSTPDT